MLEYHTYHEISENVYKYDIKKKKSPPNWKCKKYVVQCYEWIIKWEVEVVESVVSIIQ